MIAMMFVGMPAAVIGGIAWECRKRSRLVDADSVSDVPEPTGGEAPVKPR